MEFRPCIDIHNGYVKQIVGSSLKDENNEAVNNFVSDKDGAYYANLFKEYNLKGGHVILLNSANSDYRKASEEQAKCALLAFPDGLQIGGGINEENAWSYLDMGASHVIVTSYVFRCGRGNMENLEKISKCVGKNRLVIDLSCRKLDGEYKIVTDRWQNFTDISLNKETLDMFSDYCDEFLVPYNGQCTYCYLLSTFNLISSENKWYQNGRCVRFCNISEGYAIYDKKNFYCRLCNEKTKIGDEYYSGKTTWDQGKGIRLQGLENCNSDAEGRGIVCHNASYGPDGLTWGCLGFQVGFDQIKQLCPDGGLMFIIKDGSNYLEQSEIYQK